MKAPEPIFRLKRREIAYVAVLIAALILFRARTFFQPLADPTIGLYLHIGRSWLNGHLPYTQTWDYRPPGLFALYAIGLEIFGSQAANALAVISLAVTAISVGLLAKLADPLKTASTGWLAAECFVILAPENDGVAAVAEVEINAFVSSALVLALSTRRWYAAIAIGLLASMAVQCKLSALPLAAFIAFIAYRSGRKSGYEVAGRNLALGLAAFMSPILLETLIYSSRNLLYVLYDANVGASIRRLDMSSTAIFRKNLGWMFRQILLLAPQLEFGLFAFFRGANSNRLATVGWFAISLFSICVEGELYERQFVLLTPAISVLGALGISYVMRRFASRPRFSMMTIAVSLVLGFALHDYHEVTTGLGFALHRRVLGQANWRLDQTASLIQALRSNPEKPQGIYLVEQSPYIYDALNYASPTKYAYSDLILDPRLSVMAGIDGEAELRRILDTFPTTIVVSNLDDFRYDKPRVQLLVEWIKAYYRPLPNHHLSFQIYELREPKTRS